MAEANNVSILNEFEVHLLINYLRASNILQSFLFFLFICAHGACLLTFSTKFVVKRNMTVSLGVSNISLCTLATGLGWTV